MAVYRLAVGNVSLLMDHGAQWPEELMNKVFRKNSDSEQILQVTEE